MGWSLSSLLMHPLAMLDITASQRLRLFFATQLLLACERLRVLVIASLVVFVVAHVSPPCGNGAFRRRAHRCRVLAEHAARPRAHLIGVATRRQLRRDVER